MKRQIKFRGKTVANGHWVCGYYYSECGITYIIEDKQAISGLSRNIACEVIPDTVGQFIGLLDKNKREVYDGDIIKDSEGRIGQVCWDDEFLQWLIVYGDDDVERCMIGFSCEVMGNEYDNPELLKGGKE